MIFSMFVHIFPMIEATEVPGIYNLTREGERVNSQCKVEHRTTNKVLISIMQLAS